MGFGKERNRIRDKIASWGCKGFFGYGHGRAMRDFGAKPLKDKSVCLDLCKHTQECRVAHHAKMDARFPQIAEVVRQAAQVAESLGRPVVQSVGAAMQIADSRHIPGTEQIRLVLKRLKVHDMVDHYVCGQFENIQNGLEAVAPTAPCSLSVPETPPAPVVQETVDG